MEYDEEAVRKMINDNPANREKIRIVSDAIIKIGEKGFSEIRKVCLENKLEFHFFLSIATSISMSYLMSSYEISKKFNYDEDFIETFIEKIKDAKAGKNENVTRT